MQAEEAPEKEPVMRRVYPTCKHLLRSRVKQKNVGDEQLNSKQRQGEVKRDLELMTDLNKFVRRYCVFFVGHWTCKETKKGFEPTPRMEQLLRTFRERRVDAYIIDEYCTSKVSL